MRSFFSQLQIPKELPQTATDQAQMSQIVEMVLGILAVASVLMIVIGGIRFITSKGDPGATAKARNTIIYAAVGLVVAMMAFVIVQFVIGNI